MAVREQASWGQCMVSFTQNTHHQLDRLFSTDTRSCVRGKSRKRWAVACFWPGLEAAIKKTMSPDDCDWPLIFLAMENQSALQRCTHPHADTRKTIRACRVLRVISSHAVVAVGGNKAQELVVEEPVDDNTQAHIDGARAPTLRRSFREFNLGSIFHP